MRFFFTTILLFGAKLFAEPSTPEFTPDNFNFKSEFISMLATLLFVLVLVFVTIWFLKKLLRSRMQAQNLTCAIKVMEKRALGPKASLYLVDILGKGVAISESSNGIHLISELPENFNIEEYYSPKQTEKKPFFAQFLKK